MELLSVNTAKAIWIISVNDLNPRGRNLDGLIKWLTSRYQFEKYPASSFLEDQSKGFVFSTGSFPRGPREDDNIYVDLTIFNDGLVANTRSSTKDTEDFLSEALTLAAAEFHLVFRPEMIRKKLYLSELEVKLDNSLSAINPKFEELIRKISCLQDPSNPISFGCSKIFIEPDPSVQIWRPSPFQIERRLNVPISEKRYYSAAPLHTDEHLELLQMLDEQVLVR
jgi:hypothetical protein